MLFKLVASSFYKKVAVDLYEQSKRHVSLAVGAYCKPPYHPPAELTGQGFANVIEQLSPTDQPFGFNRVKSTQLEYTVNYP